MSVLLTIKAEASDAAVKAAKIRNPDGKVMRRYETMAAERIHAALVAWGKSLFKGVTADSVPLLLMRVDDRELAKPLRDELIAVLQIIAIGGSEFGRLQVEGDVYGIKKIGDNIFEILWDLANSDAAQWAITYGYELINGIAAATRPRIAAEVNYFVNNSITIGELRDRLIGASALETGGPFSATRATSIAVTETTRAYAQGNMAAWRRAGVIQKKEWNTEMDELVCPVCGPLQGVIVPMNESFYGRLDGPPAHPRCRCWISPVAADDLENFGGHFNYAQLTVDEAIKPQ